MHKKLLIIEVGGSHAEVLYSFIHIFKSQQYSISLVCNKKLWRLFPEKNIFTHKLLIADSLNLTQQLWYFWKIRKLIKQQNFNAVIIGTTEITLTRNLVYFLPAGINYTGVVHNAKKLESGATIENIVFKKVKKFLVLSNYLLKNIVPLPKYKVAAFLPIYFPPLPANSFLKKEGEFFITIPGSIDGSRRDYAAFFEALKNLNFNTNIKIILLGQYINEQSFPLQHYLHMLGAKSSNIVYFTEYLSYHTFHEYIMQSDFLLPLLKTENDEFYGRYRISGAFNLGLGYGKPMLLPATYKHNTDVNAYSYFYSSYNELAAFINNLENAFIVKEEINAAFKNAPFKNTDEVAKNLAAFIE